MRLSLSTLAALAAALLSPFVALPSAVAGDARVIVTFKSDAPLARRMALDAGDSREGAAGALAQRNAERESLLGRRAGIALRAGGHVSERTQVFFARGVTSARLVARLAADAEVESVVIDHRRQRTAAPNDPLYAAGQPANPGPAVGQWYLRAPEGAVKSSINAEGAWNLTLGKPNVIVAVLDTGVRFDHADLAGKLLPGYDFVSDVPTANDGNGWDDDPSDPGDFVTAADKASDPGNFGDCTEESSSWHGTQTASLVAAATDNGVGMASVGRKVRVLPLRVLGKCGGYDSDIQAAMRWAAGLYVPHDPPLPNNTNKAAVINLSLGSPSATCDGGYPAVVSEVLAAGAAIVVSAGNSAGEAVGIPANCPGVIAVGALRHIGTKVGYADVGPQIALSAPGGNCVTETGACLYPIITALNSGLTTPVAGGSVYSDSYNASVGTSFSAPLVAGTAALMLSARPALLPADLRRLLQASARPFPKTGSDAATPVCHAPDSTEQVECYCTTSTCGAGMLDARAAVQAAIDTFAAHITVTPVAPLPGQAVELSAADSLLAPGRTIATVKWTLIDGGGIVDGFAGSADAVTATVVPAADGRFSVSVTVTDDLGASASTELSIAVGIAIDPGTGGSGGGGGGAVGLAWLAALAAAVFATAWPQFAALNSRRARKTWRAADR